MTKDEQLVERLRETKEILDRIRKFLHAYAIGEATTFVNPRNGKLITATKEARALADACLEGPGAEQ